MSSTFWTSPVTNMHSPPSSAILGGHAGGAVLVKVEDGDLGAFGREELGGGAPNIPAAARDDRHLSVEPAHGVVLPLRQLTVPPVQAGSLGFQGRFEEEVFNGERCGDESLLDLVADEPLEVGPVRRDA